MRFALLTLSLLTSVALQAQPRTLENIPYKADVPECVLDITSVEGAKDQPVIVWFHGGGLTGGTKKTPDALKLSDKLTVSVSYRLCPKQLPEDGTPYVTVPDIIDDAAAAVAWVFMNIKTYGGDPTRVFLAGHSAGAYLVSMVTLDPKYLARYGCDPSQIRATIPYSGQAITHYTHRAQQGIGQLDPRIDDLAPIAHLRADCPPMFIISGDREKEMNGRYEENAYFVRMLKLVGHKDIEFAEIPGTTHSSMCNPGHKLALAYIDRRLEPLQSKVARYRFSDDAQTQLRELAENPMMEYYAQSRKAFADKDIHHTRPIFHFTIPENHLNDPNGLCYWKGYWHMFYQAYPLADSRQHWGHCYSTDLVHWKDLPLAIYPDPEKYVYSGACMVEDDRVIAAYYGRPVGEMIATSTDPLLLNWDKIGNSPVIPAPKDWKQAGYQTFDPYIWKKGGYYYLISGKSEFIGPDGRRLPVEYLFRSKDLIIWEHLHPFVERDRYSIVGDDRACPYFCPIGNKWILNHFSHKSGARYLVGDYDTDRDRFVVTGGGAVNTGGVNKGAFHAPSAFPDGKGGVYVIYNTFAYPATPDVNIDCMTMTYRQTIDSLDRISFSPAGDYASLRYAHVELKDVKLPANKEVVLKGVKGKELEMILEFDDNTPSLEVNVLRDPAKEEYTTITFYRDKGYEDRTKEGPEADKDPYSVIVTDSSHGSVSEAASPRQPDAKQFPLKKGEKLTLHIFVDRSIVEVFANDRTVSMVRTLPIKDESTSVSIRAIGKSTVLRKADAWKMKGIF